MQGCYAEDSSCLEENPNGGYFVYDGRRGYKYDVREFPTIKEALIEVIERITFTKEDEEALILEIEEHL